MTMKAIKRLSWGAGLLCLLLLTSCERVGGDLGGMPVTPQLLESISLSLAQTTEATPEVTPEQETLAAPDTDTVSTAQTAATTTTSATAAITEPPAQTTASLTTMTEAATTTAVPDVVYWTESGSVYHYSSSCSSLRDSAHILHGSIADALQAEKERACKRCAATTP